MKRMNIVGVTVLIIGALVLTHSQTPVKTDPPTTKTSETKPVKAKKVLVKTLPKGVKGVELKNGEFRIRAGYKFVNKSPNTTVVALDSGSGGVEGTFSCDCLAGKGKAIACKTSSNGGDLRCYAPAKGRVQWRM